MCKATYVVIRITRVGNSTSEEYFLDLGKIKVIVTCSKKLSVCNGHGTGRASQGGAVLELH